MHKLITVAAPTRHRTDKVEKFIKSLHKTTCERNNKPYVLLINDSPESENETYELRSIVGGVVPDFQVIYSPLKKGLAALWNDCVLYAPTDWVLICNDDIVFKQDWLEYLERQIATDQFDQIMIAHYGGMCIHKRMFLKLGWFEERFMGGGFEDNDWALRISESGLKDRVDMSHSFTHSEVVNASRGWLRDVGPFADHYKINDGPKGTNVGWEGRNNKSFIYQKWGYSPFDPGAPSFRRMYEVDWHPFHTWRWQDQYGIQSQIPTINENAHRKVGVIQ